MNTHLPSSDNPQEKIHLAYKDFQKDTEEGNNKATADKHNTQNSGQVIREFQSSLEETSSAHIIQDAPEVLFNTLKSQNTTEVTSSFASPGYGKLKDSSQKSLQNSRFRPSHEYKKPSRNPTSLGENFSTFIRSRGWSTRISVEAVYARWEEIVGEDNAKNSELVDLSDDGKLVLRCSTTKWAYALQRLKKHILEAFEKEIGPGIVTDIEILGPEKAKKRGYYSVKGPGLGDTYE